MYDDGDYTDWDDGPLHEDWFDRMVNRMLYCWSRLRDRVAKLFGGL